MTTEYLTETIFTWGAPPLKFGVGAIDEIGHDCGQLGLSRVLIVTDEGVAATGIPQRAAESMQNAGLKPTIFNGAHIEPTDKSFREAVEFAKETDWDGFVAVGGGSAIDTAKAVNLLTTNPGDLMEYVNKPVGDGKAPTEPLKPLVAVPTTAGTGSESTAMCVLDILALKVKTGISNPRLRPVLAIVDPLVTLTLPPHVTASCGMDVLCHALESYTARHYRSYARRLPEQRAVYVGNNPVSDAFIEKALPLLARSFRRAVLTGQDLEARTDMLLAASFAGMGFGNAGCHIPHACAYPIAGRVSSYRPPDYPQAEPMVPHGESVALTAPEAFRFTFPADPWRHLRCAELLDPRTGEIGDERERLPRAIVSLMRDIGIPSGIAAVGFSHADIPDLIEGALKQQRLLSMAPRDVMGEDLEVVFRNSMANW
ncbi:MAG TPA: hydroxyacid-oxoacid transhydrogenase [Trebonia sp.]|jgi:hydroxyacid-oxoacid transhydrogenase|nr:hydroxyacid-oxoacid transhydrogenase [Trebonia sp.]